MAIVVQKRACGRGLLEFAIYNEMLAVYLRSRWTEELSSMVPGEKTWSSCHLLLAFQAYFFQAIFLRGLVVFFMISSVKYTLLVVKKKFF